MWTPTSLLEFTILTGLGSEAGQGGVSSTVFFPAFSMLVSAPSGSTG